MIYSPKNIILAVGHHIGIFPKNFLVKLIILGDFSPKNLDLADCGSPFWYFLPQNFLVALLSTFFLPPKQIPTHLRRTTPFQVESEPRHFHDELLFISAGMLNLLMKDVRQLLHFTWIEFVPSHCT
jgi:hypothetical protein